MYIINYPKIHELQWFSAGDRSQNSTKRQKLYSELFREVSSLMPPCPGLGRFSESPRLRKIFVSLKKNNHETHSGGRKTAIDLDVLGCSRRFGVLVMMFLMSLNGEASPSDHRFTSNDSPQQHRVANENDRLGVLGRWDSIRIGWKCVYGLVCGPER